VVRFLIDQGVSPEHLMAAGFGEFQPIAEGEDDESLARNRRIEFKLTER
jgi:chemotaxis protein MotB